MAKRPVHMFRYVVEYVGGKAGFDLRDDAISYFKWRCHEGPTFLWDALTGENIPRTDWEPPEQVEF